MCYRGMRIFGLTDVLELPFYVDGERIGYDYTPETLDLSDYDFIDLILKQIGC